MATTDLLLSVLCYVSGQTLVFFLHPQIAESIVNERISGLFSNFKISLLIGIFATPIVYVNFELLDGRKS
ncbi:hypothetical protein LINPERHAP1_LOCUS15291 [Linum perenne]